MYGASHRMHKYVQYCTYEKHRRLRILGIYVVSYVLHYSGCKCIHVCIVTGI